MKVISIVGTMRSGSTLLDMLLGSVDGFFSAGELRYLWERGVIERRRCGCGLEVSECEIWSKVLAAPSLAHVDPAEVVRWQHAVARVRHTRRMLKPDAAARDARLGRLVDTMAALYTETGRVTGARVIVDSSKRPADAALAALAEGVEPYVVHLVRDPRGVAYSRRRPKAELDRDGNPVMAQTNVARAAVNWCWVNAVASTLPRGAPAVPFLRVRYEDLVAEPEACLAQILEFVQEPRGRPSVHDHVALLPQNHTVSGNPGRFSTGEVALRLDAEWLSSMGPAAWATTTTISLASLRRYGYAIPDGAPWARARIEPEHAPVS